MTQLDSLCSMATLAIRKLQAGEEVIVTRSDDGTYTITFPIRDYSPA